MIMNQNDKEYFKKIKQYTIDDIISVSINCSSDRVNDIVLFSTHYPYYEEVLRKILEKIIKDANLFKLERELKN